MSFLKRKFWENLHGRIPDFIKHDPLRKLLAFFLALLLFAYFYTSKEDSENVLDKVPVKVELPEGFLLMGKAPDPVEVTLKRGVFSPESDLKKYVEIVVNVTEQPGQSKYKFDLKGCAKTRRFSGLKVISVVPSELTLQLDKKSSKAVRVDADLTKKVNLAEGYEVVKVTCEPEKVLLSGPASLLEEIDSVSTVEIPFDPTIIRKFKYAADLVEPRGGPQVTVMGKKKVIVTLDVVKSHSQKRFRQVPVKLLMGSGVDTVTGVEIVSAKAVDVTVTGLKNTLDTVSESDIIPYADVSAIRKNGLHNNIPVRCWSPKTGVSIQSVVPDSINVRVGPHVKK